MHFEYWVLVTRDAQGSVLSLYSPDLKEELLESQEAVTPNFNYRLHIKTRIIEELQNRHRIIFPKNFDELENIQITPLQHWEGFKINSKKKNPICEVSLPISGHFCNVLAILTNVFITFMALKIANQDPNDEDSDQGTGLAIAGSIFTSVINLFLYILSGATETLNETGVRLDNLCRSPGFADSQGSHLGPTVVDNRKILLHVVAGLSIGGSSFVAAVRQYQEFMLLADKYLSLDPNRSESEHNKYLNIIKYLVILTNIISSTYTATAFQAAFARKLIAQFRDRTENQHSEHDALVQRFAQSTHLLSDHFQSSKSNEESLQLGQNSRPAIQFSGGTVPPIPAPLASNSNIYESKLISKLDK